MCAKCGYTRLTGLGMEVHHVTPRSIGGADLEDNLVTLCSICHYFVPNDADKFKVYLCEMVDGSTLESFRKYGGSIAERTLFGMQRKSKEGGAVNRPPKGYIMQDKKLVPDPYEAPLIAELFSDFLNNDISLNKLAQRYNLTINGLKKVLTNVMYVGSVSFGGVVHQGVHIPLISTEIFNQVQNKLRLKNIGFNRNK